jgi:hypothetical protein
MGRIRNWMDRMSGRRAAAPRREVHRARRRLAFERCEPRLTLSAAAPTAIDDSAADSLILFDVLDMQTVAFQTDGLQTFDSVGWEQAQPQGRQTTFVFRDSLRASLNAQGGGVVDLNALPLNAVMTDGTPTFSLLETTQSIVRAAFADDGVGSRAGAPTLNAGTHLATLETSFGDFSYQPNLLPDWNTFIPRDNDDGLSAQEPTNLYGDGGDLESEMIRIDAPRQESEGGTIELTAMLGPQPTLSASAPLRLAATRGLEGNANSSMSSAVMSQRQLTPTEGLRARAVVVNVALVRDAAGIDDAASLSPRLTDPASGEQSPAVGNRNAAPQRTRNASGQAAQDFNVPAPDAALQAGEAAADEAAPAAAAQAVQPDDGDTAATDRRAARDAALGDWAAAPVERDREDAVTVAGTHDRRYLGAAVALVAGVGPVIRRARRGRGATPGDVDEAAGLR